MIIKTKVEFDEDTTENGAWHVFTSKNGNGWWGLGVDFATEETAQAVANFLRASVSPGQAEDFFTEEVDTQGGGYDRCALCGATDYNTPTINHESACTAGFRNAVLNVVA